METNPIVIERTFNTTRAKLWKAITDKNEMKLWYFDLVDFKAEPGFTFSFPGGPSPERQYIHLCEVTEAIAEQKLTYSWRYEGYEGISYVTFELMAAEHGTKLRLTHAGLNSFPADNPDLQASNFVEGWTAIIGKNLLEYTEKQ